MKNFEEMTVKELVELGGEAKSPQRVNSDKAFKARMRQEDKRTFVQVEDGGVKGMNKTLNLTQAGTFLSLLAYMDMNKEGLLYFNQKALSAKDIAELTGKSARSVQTQISELVSLGYVRSEKVGRSFQYYIDPRLASRGTRTEKDFFTKLYNVQLRETIQKLTVQELGLLFMMIPYFNTKFYTLCRNPHELDANKVELFDRERFAEEVGISLVQVKRLIASLLKKQALVGLRTCRTALIITPKLVSRQNRFVTIEEVTDVIGNELNVRERMEW
ncbi:hypothetical protein SRABI80_03108 [Peribacillus frigoritolerans]|uniref:helix-turn-helix domain-containing protein n=1 Tax=Peribacillus frigoritolerans TaxID=450367 RepID=UPI001D480300|nr:helix-turn-helix domain-containing protein [Peribacillus frigoritolerans]CAH0256329.1 hypothetical protein SRABI80_03108 [Peribacillus frigoritolerans]